MSLQSGRFDRQPKYFLPKRVAKSVIACALLSLVWLSAGSDGQFRKSFSSMSQQVAQSASSAASASAGDEQSNLGIQMHNITTPSIDVSSLAPFPPLPPPDTEEYMAICMAGQYSEAWYSSRYSRELSEHHSEESIHGSSRILHPLLFPPRHSALLHLRRRKRAPTLQRTLSYSPLRHHMGLLSTSCPVRQARRPERRPGEILHVMRTAVW